MTAETPQTFAYGAASGQKQREESRLECGFDAYCSPSQVVASYLLASTKAGTTHPARPT